MLWTDTDCLLMDAYSVTFTVTSAGGPAPPRFLGARNTLVLGSYCPSFDIFHAMFVRAVKEAYEEELAMLEKWPSKENA
ncbi:hypothetical protein BaRGS_00011411 [Batillaria attramentaria]|uniref:Uncharacterized protein n=1 Tax=Batillaria attramentaria TaxID=370345 RepID=A0ABD0LEE1_9CAEN